MPPAPTGTSIPETLPPQGAVGAPSYGYVAELLNERNRLFGTVAVSTGATATASGSSTGVSSNQQRRSFDVRTREFRLRRQLRVDPRIPPNYRRTTQVIRAGQSLLADLALRIPALLTTKPMQVHAQPLDDGDDAEQAASQKEEWTHAVLLGKEGERSILDQGATSVWRDWYDNLVNTGWGCFTLTARQDRWSDAAPGYPQRATYAADGQGARDYQAALERYRRAVCPFVQEHVDPLMVFIKEDDEGVEDEALVTGLRPVRQTLSAAGLVPLGNRGETQALHGPGVLEGKSGFKYRAGPAGLGKAYPLRDWPTGVTFLEGVETITYYCSARRAASLGLIGATAAGQAATDASVGQSGSIGTNQDGSAAQETSSAAGDTFDPDCGVWAQFVDGVLVQSGPLWGPSWHPLPLFRAFGLSTSMPDPVYRGVPASLALLELADALDQIFTMKMHVAYWSAWPAILEEDKTGGGVGATGLPQDVLADPEQLGRPGAGATKERKVIEPAGFYPLPAGRTWRHFVLPAEAMAHLQSLEADVRAMLDLLGVPSVFRGAGQGGTSGYAIAQLTLAARSLYDPVVENATACVAQAVKYLWWQVWKRFPEGVPAYAGVKEAGSRKKKGWITLTPRDVAPDYQSARQPGVPFLACRVQADPLLPVDETQLEQRGINALGAHILSEDTVRDKYFKVQAPEEEGARVLADLIVHDPVSLATLVVRGQVRMGLLMPELAPLVLGAKLGIPPELAAKQLAFVGGLPPDVQQKLELQAMQAQGAAGGVNPGAAGVQGAVGTGPGGPQLAPQQIAQMIAAGGLAPGQAPVPGMPGVPGMGLPGLPVAAPVPPQAPPILPGAQPGAPLHVAVPGAPGMAGGLPQRQPLPQQRQARTQ